MIGHAWQMGKASAPDGLPGSGLRLRDAPRLQLCVNMPYDTAPADLHTEIWLPIAT